MAFEIEERKREGIPVLALRGRFTIGEPVEAVRSRLDTALAEGHPHIVLDLTKTEYIDSSALGCLVVAYTRTQRAGGALPIFGLNKRGLDLMVITKLITVLRICPDEIAAVNSCFPDRELKRFDILNFVESQKGGEPEAG
jgi:anti-sigma B factor antagonist